MSTDLNGVQPKPMPGLRDLDLSSWVAADLLHRFEATGEAGLDAIADAVLDAAAHGEAKYSSRLHALNGRNPAIDAFQECRDQIQYLFQLAVTWELVNRRQAELLARLSVYEADGRRPVKPTPPEPESPPLEERYDALIRAAVLTERERCATIAERQFADCAGGDACGTDAHVTARLIAGQIRAG